MRGLRKCLDTSINAVFTVAEPRKPPKLPPISNRLLLEPASELARKIARGELKSMEVMLAYIGRIKSINGYINAVVDERFEDAIKESEEIDRMIEQCDIQQRDEILRQKPFIGVPVTTKNLVGIKGLLIDVGLVSRRGIRAMSDAGAIEMMRRAGAIPLAITNVSELAMWWESNNKVHGRTRNPYDLRRNPGGSSGGEGSLIAAAGSIIGIGTDIGGSIRMPAFFNGIFGHKPSPGIVSNSGQYPEVIDVQLDFLGTGPMCRYAKDLRPMLQALVGEETAKELKLDESIDFKRLKVYYMEEINRSFLMSPVCDEVKGALRDVINHLQTVTSSPAEEKNFEAMAYAFEIWNYLMTSGNSPKFNDVLRESGSEMSHPFTELLKWCSGQSTHTFPAMILAIAEKYQPNKDSPISQKFISLGDQLRKDFLNLLSDNEAVFLCPTHPEPAPKHRTPVFKGFNFAYTGIFNVLKLPVTACPVRLGEDSGLPVGIQVVAGPNQDRLCLAVAEEIERAFGGWVDPSEPCKQP